MRNPSKGKKISRVNIQTTQAMLIMRQIQGKHTMCGVKFIFEEVSSLKKLSQQNSHSQSFEIDKNIFIRARSIHCQEHVSQHSSRVQTIQKKPPPKYLRFYVFCLFQTP